MPKKLLKKTGVIRKLGKNPMTKSPRAYSANNQSYK
jgi:hypothetical protein